MNFCCDCRKGPCKPERIDARRKAWEGGKWVRESAAVYAQKRQAQQQSKRLPEIWF